MSQIRKKNFSTLMRIFKEIKETFEDEDVTENSNVMKDLGFSDEEMMDVELSLQIEIDDEEDIHIFNHKNLPNITVGDLVTILS